MPAGKCVAVRFLSDVAFVSGCPEWKSLSLRRRKLSRICGEIILKERFYVVCKSNQKKHATQS